MQNNAIESHWAALEGPVAERQSLEVWGFLRRRKSFIFVLAVVGAGIGYLLYQQQVPVYQSIARLEIINRVSDRFSEGMIGKDMHEDAEYVIPSMDVLGPAFDENSLSELESCRGILRIDAIEMISKALSIEQLSASVIELMFDGPNERDTAVIADAVANEYIRRQTNSYETQTDKLGNLLNEDLGEIQEELGVAEDALAEFLSSAPLLSLAGHHERLDESRVRLAEMNGQLNKTDIRALQLRSELELLDRTLREDGKRAALCLLIEKEEPDDPIAGVELQFAQRQNDSLIPLLVRESTLADTVGPGHPELVALRRQIAVTREQFQKLSGTFLGADGEAQQDFLVSYVGSLKLELNKLEDERGELQAMVVAAESGARVLQDKEQEYKRLSGRVDRLQRLVDNVGTTITHTELNADMSGVSAKVIEAAGLGVLVFPRLYQFLGVGGFLGAAFGLGLGYLVELADKSFRKPEEIVREFGVPIVGHIPYMKEQRLRGITESTTMHRTVVSAHLPRSRPAEAYRSVRTAVCFSAMGDSHRVLQVTSPAAGDGKSTLAVNLAVSLAQSGKSTILVESDFRRPSVHRMTGVSNEMGIVEVLRGQAELADVIQSTEVEEFYVLPCGHRPRNPSELLTRPEYEELLDVLRQKFDYIVVDSPPVLVVTDPSSVAPRVDAVIVCMRLSRHTRDFGRRTLDQLRDVGANVVGLAVNGVEEADAYGYGTYNYSDYRNNYYQSTSYAYPYNYVDGSDGYFSEDDETVRVKRLLATAEESPPAESAD